MKQVRYIHIPKTGGSFVKKALEHNPQFAELSLNYKKGRQELDDPNTIVFSVIRNPFDLLVSYWTSKHQRSPHRTSPLPCARPIPAYKHVDVDYKYGFEFFVLSFLYAPCHPSTWQYWQQKDLFFQLMNKDGTCSLDHVFKLETLNDDLPTKCKEWGLDYKPKFEAQVRRGLQAGKKIEEKKRFNASRTEKVLDYRQWFSFLLKEKISERIAPTMERWSYKF